MNFHILLLLFCCQLAVANQGTNRSSTHTEIDNFPAINQREIEGAEFRCGTVALGSWIQWLTKNGKLPAPIAREFDVRSPFANADLLRETKTILARLDTLADGTDEIKLSSVVKALIEYIHQLPDPSLKLTIHYYNLPSEALLRNLAAQEIPVILFHGIYDKQTKADPLKRSQGHYTCLVGQTESQLIANTYAINYQFNLTEIPMANLVEKDRYKPSGFESLIYLRCPEGKYPRYSFRSFAAQDKANAQLQQNQSGQIFAEADETILLEGALAFQITTAQ